MKTKILLFIALFFLVISEVYAQKNIQWAPTGLYENGKEILLEVVISKPETKGPYPTLIFNHGSTGNGNPEVIKKTTYYQTIESFFTQRGWLVVFPQRRGRGQSGGLYDEGLNPNRFGYSCDTKISLLGMERALEDLDVVVRYLKHNPDVDQRKMLIGGVSRGGILSIVYAGTRSNNFKGVINFVGGWKNDRCVNVKEINTDSFKKGASFKHHTLWLYGIGDSFYSIKHSRMNFNAFTEAGGKGTFIEYSLPFNQNGHNVILNPNLWEKDLELYLNHIK